MKQHISKLILAATMAGVAATQAQDTIIKPVGVILENQRANATSDGPWLQYGSPLGSFWYDGSGLSADLATGDPVPDPWPTHGAYSTSTISRVRDTGETVASPVGEASLVFDLGGSHTLSGIALWNSNEAGTNGTPVVNNTTRGIENMTLAYSTDGGTTFTPSETLSSWTEGVTGTIDAEIKMLASSVPNVTHVRIVVTSFIPGPIVTFNEIRMISSPITFDGDLVITQVPGTATAGVDFSPGVIVEARDTNDQPLAVSTDTVITLGASGTGTLTGNTATILAGQSSVTLNTVNYTKAETITLSASRTSGDSLAPSAASSTIIVSAAAASQLVVETAADGSGVPVPDQVVYLPNSLTVYAISRDTFGNFVANEPATWSLANITGDVVSGDLVDNTGGSATFTGNGLGTANIRATFGSFADADSGLITVEELIHRYSGLGNVGSWQTAGNWTGGIGPAFDNTTDLFFSESTNTRGTPYVGTNSTVRALTFDIDATPAAFNITFVQAGNATPANLTFDTDSATEPAEINIAAAFTKPLTLGGTGSTSNEGAMILVDNLLINHDGSAKLEINTAITGAGSLTKAGTGNLILSGSPSLSGINTYTGDTVVNGGTLTINGESITDTAKLVINGGIVDVTGDEIVGALDLGSGPVADGIYGSSSSAAPVENQDDTKFSGTGTVEVVTPVSGYGTWATTNVGGQTPSEDFNNDGVDNGIAYFMNDTGIISLPGIVGGAVTWSNGGNIPASAYGTEFVVETSQDLVIWTPVDAVDLTTNNDTTLTYTLPTGQGKWFVRLEVTPN